MVYPWPIWSFSVRLPTTPRTDVASDSSVNCATGASPFSPGVATGRSESRAKVSHAYIPKLTRTKTLQHLPQFQNSDFDHLPPCLRGFLCLEIHALFDLQNLTFAPWGLWHGAPVRMAHRMATLSPFWAVSLKPHRAFVHKPTRDPAHLAISKVTFPRPWMSFTLRRNVKTSRVDPNFHWFGAKHTLALRGIQSVKTKAHLPNPEHTQQKSWNHTLCISG